MKKLLRAGRIIFAVMFGCALASADAGATVITNDVFMKDTSGNPIYAQGGGVFKFNGIYYWYGVKYNGAETYQNDPSAGKNSDTSFAGISCYSSTNLVDWKFERLSTSGLGGYWVGRMGVCYNTNTHQYVLIAQQNAGIMFATSSTPNGTFVYHHTQNTADLSFLANSGTGDQTVFVDDDGTPYVIASSVSGRSHLYVLPLRASDYLEVLPGTEIYHGSGREGNCMFKYNGKYYFCSSDLHGWNASHCYVLESQSSNIMGPYLPEYVMDRSDLDFCHVTQTGFFYTVHGTNGTTVLFVGDRWCDFAGNGIGYNQWNPLTFNGTKPTFNSVTAFDLDAAAGTWSVAPGNNYILNPAYEADRVTQAQVAGWTSTGSGYGNASGSGHVPGRFHYRHFSTNSYSATTHQLVTGLPNGTYRLSVWYKSSGGQSIARIFARNYGGAELDVNINTPQSVWTQVTISNVAVVNGQCDVGLYSVASANQSVDIDDWSLTYVEQPPAAPTGLIASPASSTQINLSWTDNATNETRFNIERSTDGVAFSQVGSTTADATEYQDGGLAPVTQYTYRVRAFNAVGESGNTNTVSATTLAGPPSAPAAFTANSAAARVELVWNASPGAGSYRVKRSTTGGGPYMTIAAGVSGTNYTDTAVNDGVTYYYVVSAANDSGESPNSDEASASPGKVIRLWRFDDGSGTTAIEAISGFNGTLAGGASWTADRLGNAVALDGTSGTVSFPNGVVSSLKDFSIAGWFYLNSIGTWSRIFDFGTGTTVNMFLTPQAGGTGGAIRYAITTTGNSAEDIINGTAVPSTGAWHHFAVTLNGTVGVLYVDGVEVGRNSGMTITPADLGITTQNWVGRSQYSSDPYLNGRVDDLRIYNYGLSASEIAALATGITSPPAPNGLNATAVSSSQIDLNWTASTSATSFRVKRATSPGGPYTTVAGGLTETSFSDTELTSGTTYYYVVSAFNVAGESPNSAQANATPIQPQPPLVSTINLIGDQIVFGGINGPTQGSYYVLTSTNLALPLTNWTPIATNQFSADGHFAVTNAVDPEHSQHFYMLQLP